jgi:hypothetical protein
VLSYELLRTRLGGKGRPELAADPEKYRKLGESSESHQPAILLCSAPYTMCMNISLTFSDLTKLAVNGKVEKDGNTLSVSRPILPDVETSADGLRGFVRFTVDESDPRSKPPVQAER